MKNFKAKWAVFVEWLKIQGALLLKWLGMFLAGLVVIPLFTLGWALHKVARLLLAIAYTFMFDLRKARDIVKYLFNYHERP